MTTSIAIRLPSPHASQRRVLTQARRYTVLACGRRWGKTQLGILLAVEAAIGVAPNSLSLPYWKRPMPPTYVGWFAPTYKLLAEAWRELAYVLAPLAYRVNGQEHRIELRTGGVVEMWTLERPDPARGRKYGLVIIDEAAMVRHLEEAWTMAIRPTLVDLGGRAVFASTPKGRNYFYELYTMGASGEDPDWIAFQLPSHANPYLRRSELEAARRSMPETAFRQEHLAEFLEVQGAIIRREWVRYGTPPAPLPTYMGVDLAISTREGADYSAIAVLSRDDEGRLWVRDVRRGRWTFHETLLQIQSMAERWKPRVIGIEAVQYQAAVVQELLRTTALPVVDVRPDRDKVARALPLQKRYELGLVYHDPSLPREFEAELLTFPEGEHDDMVDAMVYAFESMSRLTGLSYEEQLRHAAR